VQKRGRDHGKVRLGLFGDKPNAHARRQDALVAHVYHIAGGAAMNYLARWIFAEETAGSKFDFEQFEEWWNNNPELDVEKFYEWLGDGRKFKFSDAQMKVVNEHPWIKAGNSLLDLARKNRLQQLREFGLYENVGAKFSDEVIGQVLELSAAVHVLLKQSRHMPMPAAPTIELIPRDE